MQLRSCTPSQGEFLFLVRVRILRIFFGDVNVAHLHSAILTNLYSYAIVVVVFSSFIFNFLFSFILETACSDVTLEIGSASLYSLHTQVKISVFHHHSSFAYATIFGVRVRVCSSNGAQMLIL